MVALVVAVLAGALTTLAGMGGGMVLVLFFVAWTGSPVDALFVTSMGLFAGNVHRAWLYRRDIDRRLAATLVLGALPASLLGGWIAVDLPDAVLRSGIAAMALVGVAVVAFGARVRPPRVAVGAAGATVGLVSATTGGGGLLAGPFLLANGLSGRAYVATGAVMALAIHTGRLVGYGSGGAATPDALWLGLGLAVAVPLGNLVGHRLRAWLPDGSERRLELGTAALVASLALAGLT